MRNPTYSNDKAVPPIPYTESSFSPPWKDGDTILSMGVKTMTHNHRGESVHPFQCVAVQILQGEEKASAWIDARTARLYARRLLEFADAIDEEKSEVKYVKAS